MEPRRVLVFDLETVTDPEFCPPAPPGAEPAERPFAPLHAQVPIVAGLLWLDADLSYAGLEVLSGDERSLLQSLAGLIQQHRPQLVSFNGRAFDLPVILLRCLRHGLSLPWYYGDGAFRRRYSQQDHLDLCDLLSEHGAWRRISLDVASRLMGLPGKGLGVDGSQVEPLFEAGQLEQIQRYCLTDVVQTGFLLLRVKLLQGQLDGAGYRRVASALHQALAHEPRLAELWAGCRLDRLLMTDSPVNPTEPASAEPPCGPARGSPAR